MTHDDSCRSGVRLYRLKALMQASMKGEDRSAVSADLPWLTEPDDNTVDLEGFMQAMKVGEEGGRRQESFRLEKSGRFETREGESPEGGVTDDNRSSSRPRSVPIWFLSARSSLGSFPGFRFKRP